MKAVLWQGGNEYRFEEVPDPVFTPNQVVARVEATAICGSDRHLADFKLAPPLIPGHEAAGVVVEIGAQVKHLSVGDRVACDPVQRCGACWCCTHNRAHLCSNFRHLGYGDVPGTWAEFVAIDEANAHRISDTLDFPRAALLEPAAVCFESFQRAGFRPGDQVLIVGDGPFGFLHAQVARALGASVILVAGHYDRRLERIAAKTGAITCNSRTGDVAAMVAEHAEGGSVDIAIEASGAGPAPNCCIRALRPQGTAVLFSYVWEPETLEMGRIHMNELNLVGACRSSAGYRNCLELIGRGAIDPQALIDIQAPLSDCVAVLDRLSSDKGNIFKAVLLPGARTS
ncbi:MAG: zinc-binding dehydrogenase [Acidobacteriota bacterium]